MAALFLPMEMIHSPQVMINASAETGGSMEIMTGLGTWLQQRWALGRNRTKAGIEWVTGYRLGSGHGYRSGCEF